MPPRDSNPNSVYKIKRDEEHKEIERKEQQELDKIEKE